MTEPAADAQRRETTLRFMAAPTDVSTLDGTIDAGRVLEYVDRAAYACAVSWSGNYCVTVYAGGAHFRRPIRSGDVVEVTASVVYTGRTSMHIQVVVTAADPRSLDFGPVTSCVLVFVAVDADRRPTVVPSWEPVSDDDVELAHLAFERIAPRAAIQRAMDAAQYTSAGTGHRSVLRFLAAPGDINWGGNTHGGTIMRWIDEATTLCATSWSGRRAVAVYAGGIRFARPVAIGDVVEVDARLIYTGRSAMHIAVHVRSSDPITLDMRMATRCLTVLVTLDADGRSLPAPSWRPVTGEDHRLRAHALEMIELRNSIRSLESIPL